MKWIGRLLCRHLREVRFQCVGQGHYEGRYRHAVGTLHVRACLACGRLRMEGFSNYDASAKAPVPSFQSLTGLHPRRLAPNA